MQVTEEMGIEFRKIHERHAGYEGGVVMTLQAFVDKYMRPAKFTVTEAMAERYARTFMDYDAGSISSMKATLEQFVADNFPTTMPIEVSDREMLDAALAYDGAWIEQRAFLKGAEWYQKASQAPAESLQAKFARILGDRDDLGIIDARFVDKLAAIMAEAVDSTRG